MMGKEVEKLEVTANDINTLPVSWIKVPSATHSEHAVYVGSIIHENGYHSSSLALRICQFLLNAVVDINLIINNTNSYFQLIANRVQSIKEHDRSRILLVDNSRSFDVYVTGSFPGYYTAGTIHILPCGHVTVTNKVGTLVNVSDLNVFAEYYIKDLPKT